MRRALLLAVAFSLAASVASALGPPAQDVPKLMECLPFEDQIAQLRQRYNEVVVVATSKFGPLPALQMASPATGTFSWIVVAPDDMTCIKFFGEDLSTVQFNWGRHL